MDEINFVYDGAIKLLKAMVHVYSDSVLCLGKIHEHPVSVHGRHTRSVHDVQYSLLASTNMKCILVAQGSRSEELKMLEL